MNINELNILNKYLTDAVNVNIKKNKSNINIANIEYKNGKKISLTLYPNGKYSIQDDNSFNSIVDYVARGKGGNNNYRGNCCPQIIKQYLDYAQKKLNDNIVFFDAMEGSGTSRTVVSESKFVKQAYFGDLRYGFDALKNQFNELTNNFAAAPNVIWIHPPYFVPQKKDGSLSSMPQYSGVQWGSVTDKNLNDGSHLNDYSKYLSWLNELTYRLYEQLAVGGYIGILIGDSRCEGNYYSPILEMNRYGTLESLVIKKQNNYISESKNYNVQNFIPIEHEYLLILRKTDNINVPVNISKSFDISIFKVKNITWKSLIQNLIDHMGKANIDQLLALLEEHPKAKNNNNIRPKIRQTLNSNKNLFLKDKFGNYYLHNYKRKQVSIFA